MDLLESDILIDKMSLSMQNLRMNKQQEDKLKKSGIFDLELAKKVGLSQPAVSRLVKEGLLLRVARGLYAHPKAPLSRETGFQIACAKFGTHAAIGGLSALAYYNLAEQVPTETWVIVPPSTRSREAGYHLIRTKNDPGIGVISQKGFKIVSIERALIEGLKFSTKIGKSIALKALRIALQKKQTTMPKLRKTASDLNLDTTLARFLEELAL